jgi:DNA-binding NarL/FixJ family response regulator
MSLRIFLADDHAVVRDGLRFLLEAQPDFKVVGDAANGRAAVLQTQQLRPDVVIMDIAMPEMSGTEATRQIRQTCPETQVVILSMHATTVHIFQALQAGARGYLLKESAGAEVVVAVRAVYAGSRYLSQAISETLVDDYLSQHQTTENQNPLAHLSAREREILPLVAAGRSSAEIANIMSLAPSTVDTYRSRLMRKLGIEDIPSLVKFALEQGLITPT